MIIRVAREDLDHQVLKDHEVFLGQSVLGVPMDFQAIQVQKVLSDCKVGLVYKEFQVRKVCRERKGQKESQDLLDFLVGLVLVVSTVPQEQ